MIFPFATVERTSNSVERPFSTAERIFGCVERRMICGLTKLVDPK